ncbi:AlbA family DNA-binding domain-containing protein [Modestobacter roseus]|uniref:AlbA family DNA-binding domain-containing protein n=1 Tax=Modestobacter roseus TaxID=1181884 RepID=UPI0012966162|nr:ATP-binding protein [Modestobacter roseus]MQA35746.1 hypothetical protein [Modestobacter roseus]
MAFLSPDLPRWTPTTEGDIRQAVEDGVLGESHYWDAKREVSVGSRANKRLAADLAAFAVDGGSLLIGLDEDKEAGTFALSPGPTAGMPERIGSIASTAVDPPLFVVVTTIQAEPPTDEDGAARGYLLVEVPPSPRAPHQVDGVYWGRGDKQNIRLSDAEVHRLHALRQSQADRGLALLEAEAARDPMPMAQRSGGHLYLVAEPLSAAPSAATAFLRDQDARDVLWRHGVTEEIPDIKLRDRDVPPSPQQLTTTETRAGGLALTTHVLAGSGRQLNEWDRRRSGGPDDDLLDIEFLCNGGIRALAGRATIRPGHLESSWIVDRLVVAYTRRLTAWALRYGEAYGYRGSWLLGIRVDGLTGLASSEFADHLAHGMPPRFSEPTYEAVTTATLQELLSQPWEVMSRLVGDLVWSLGTAMAFRSVLEAPTGS